MILPSNSQITDELLSAYIDDAVTPQERLLVEAALKNDPAVAGRLEALRQTVQLLQQLPPIALPRSFVLSHTMLAEKRVNAPSTVTPPVAAPRPQPKPIKLLSRDTGGFWQRWAEFWQGGNLLLRNAATVSFALFLILVGGDLLFAPQTTVPRSPEILLTEAPVTQVAAAPTATNVARATPPLSTVTEAPPVTSLGNAGATEAVTSLSGPGSNQNTQRIPSNDGSDAIVPGEDPGIELGNPRPESGGVGGGGIDSMGSGGGGPPELESKIPGGAEFSTSTETNNIARTADMTIITSAATSQLLTESVKITPTTLVSNTQGLPTVEVTVTLTPTAELIAMNPTTITNTVQATDSPRTRAESAAGEQQERAFGLQFVQIVTILATLLFGLLWWRSHAVVS